MKDIPKIFIGIKVICSALILLIIITLSIYKRLIPFNFTSSPTAYVSILDESEKSKLVKYGYELFQNTPIYIGPNIYDSAKIFSGNNLACSNCHLWAGTKPFSASLVGVVNRFPQYRSREHKLGTIKERINGCMERSMNGRMIPLDSYEMKALVGYLKWIGRNAPEEGEVFGQGFMKINLPNRAVNLENGRNL